MRSSNDVDPRIRAEFLDELINQTRINQRFIALDVNDEHIVFRVAYDFRDAIGSATMFGRSQSDLCAPIERGLGDPHVVSGNDQRVQFFCMLTAFPDVSQKRLSCNWMQWFSRKTCR